MESSDIRSYHTHAQKGRRYAACRFDRGAAHSSFCGEFCRTRAVVLCTGELEKMVVYC